MTTELSENKLLDDIKSSIMNMQNQMQSTYTNLAEIILTGESNDKTVRIQMSATYTFHDIDFDKRAFEGGVGEFKRRIREAWKDLSDRIQKKTQSHTMDLLQGMDIPDEIRNLGVDEQGDDQ